MAKIYLHEFTEVLANSYVRLELEFLSILLKNASKSPRPHFDTIFVDKIGSKINKKQRRSINIHQWMKGLRSIPFYKLHQILELSEYSWTDIENNLLSIKSGNTGGEIKLIFPINPGREMGSIVGHILGDGSLDKRYSQISYCNSRYELLSEFQNYMEQTFGTKGRIWMNQKSTSQGTKWSNRIDSLKDLIPDRCASIFIQKLLG